jgi:hypothetical protein
VARILIGRVLAAATDSVDVGRWLGSVAPTVGQKAMAASVPVVIASDQSPVPVTGSFAQPSAGVVTTVVVGVASATLLAANAARLGAIIRNAANSDLYVKLAATASTASYSIRMDGRTEFFLPFPAYTGVIDAIRAAGAGDVLITELT